jgi:hypothetical protein
VKIYRRYEGDRLVEEVFYNGRLPDCDLPISSLKNPLVVDDGDGVKDALKCYYNHGNDDVSCRSVTFALVCLTVGVFMKI